MTVSLNDSTALFRCDSTAVFAEYLGHQSWSLRRGAEPPRSATNETVGTLLREMLGLSGDIPYNTKSLTVETSELRGWIKNNTFPTKLWFYDLGGPRGGCAGSAEPLDAAIWATLVAAGLLPSTIAEAPPVALDAAQFSAEALEASSDHQEWANALAEALSMRLRVARAPQATVVALVEQLQCLGHSLSCLDEAGEFQIWISDDQPTRPGPRFSLHAIYPPYEEPTVEVGIQTGAE